MRIFHQWAIAALAAMALVGCSGADGQSEATASSTDALQLTFQGPLVLLDGTCATVSGSSLVTQTCNDGSAQQFSFPPGGYGTIKTAAGLCLAVGAGFTALQATACDGSTSQNWSVRGGIIVSANESDGRPHCIEAPIDLPGGTIYVASCNREMGQSFWPAGVTLSFRSALRVGRTLVQQCLDVKGNIEQDGAILDVADCNSTTAQLFVLSRYGQVKLANKPSLCLIKGPNNYDSAPVALSPCSAQGSLSDTWRFLNLTSVSGANVTYGSALQPGNMPAACLEETGINGSPVDVGACDFDGAIPQLWIPTVASP
jgi:hypothetical protein